MVLFNLNTGIFLGLPGIKHMVIPNNIDIIKNDILQMDLDEIIHMDIMNT